MRVVAQGFVASWELGFEVGEVLCALRAVILWLREGLAGESLGIAPRREQSAQSFQNVCACSACVGMFCLQSTSTRCVVGLMLLPGARGLSGGDKRNNLVAISVTARLGDVPDRDRGDINFAIAS